MSFSPRSLGTRVGVRRFHETRFSHPARAPEESVVGGESRGEPARVVEQDGGRPVDPLQQASAARG